MVAAIPPQLTDPYWKRIESAAGVSNTGVGKLLRDAKPKYDAFATALARIEQANGADAKAAVKPRADASAAIRRAGQEVGRFATKVKDEKKKAILTTYQTFANHIADEIDKFDLEDHRGFNVPLERFNDRVQMWAKWVTDGTHVKLK